MSKRVVSLPAESMEALKVLQERLDSIICECAEPGENCSGCDYSAELTWGITEIKKGECPRRVFSELAQDTRMM